MPRIIPTHWRIQERILEAEGFAFRGQDGSHRAYTRAGIIRPVILPAYRQVPVSIIRNNLRTAGISHERYFELLAQVS